MLEFCTDWMGLHLQIIIHSLNKQVPNSNRHSLIKQQGVTYIFSLLLLSEKVINRDLKKVLNKIISQRWWFRRKEGKYCCVKGLPRGNDLWTFKMVIIIFLVKKMWHVVKMQNDSTSSKCPKKKGLCDKKAT